VVGHIGFLKKDLKFQNTIFPSQFIGGICIDKNYQGMGLFSEFFTDLESEYEQESALHILWGDLHKVYRRFDFYPAGIQYANSPSSETSLKEIPFKSFAHLYNKIHDTHLAPVRSEADWQSLSHITSAQLFADDKNYFFVNKGFDLTNVAHEYYFTDKNIKLPYTHWSRTESGQKEHVALVKIVNPKYFHELFTQYPMLKNVTGEELVLNCIESIKAPSKAITPIHQRLKISISGLDSI
jgi:hypothetical protein